MGEVRRNKFGLMLGLALAAAVTMMMLGGALAPKASAKGCGSMSFSGTSYKASVDKGSVSCSSAKSLLRKAVNKSGSKCGTPQLASCSLGGGWKGRTAYAGESPVVAFAYVPSSRTPAIPFYSHGKFRKSVALRSSSSRSLASRSGRTRDCGNVVFKPDPYGSGGEVTSTGVKCHRARKMVLKCGKKGQAPRGWSAFMKGYSGTFVLKHGNKRIATSLAGGGPPKLEQCLN